MKLLHFLGMALFLVGASHSRAFAGNSDQLICQVKVNTVLTSEKSVSVAPHSTVQLAEVQGFRLKLNHLGNAQFEIEAFDGVATTRSYAKGFLRDLEDDLNWAFWSRDILLETSCRLAQS